MFGMKWCMFVNKGGQGGVILFVESISIFKSHLKKSLLKRFKSFKMMTLILFLTGFFRFFQSVSLVPNMLNYFDKTVFPMAAYVTWGHSRCLSL